MQHSQKQSAMGSMAFLLLSLPLGIIYFTLIVVGLCLSLGTLVIWIGLPILFATLGLARGLGAVERQMISQLVNIPFPKPAPIYEAPQKRTFFHKFGRLLRDPLSWTSALYMFIKLPLGIISFTITVVMFCLSLAFTLAPVAYLINVLVAYILVRSGIEPSHNVMVPYFIETSDVFEPVMLLRSFLIVPFGLLLWVGTRYTLNALARFSAVIARALLCPIDSAPPITPWNDEREHQQPMSMSQAYLYQ